MAPGSLLTSFRAYLIGLAESAAELEHALILARKTTDVRLVVNFVEVASPGQ